jgi:hypothetical protein
MFGSAQFAVPALLGSPASDDLVVLCGGTEEFREAARTDHCELVDHSPHLVVGDVQSLLRCAPRSSAVIVCGELAGISASTVERLIRQRAPQARLVRADRAVEQARSARRRVRNGLLRRRPRPAAALR